MPRVPSGRLSPTRVRVCRVRLTLVRDRRHTRRAVQPMLITLPLMYLTRAVLLRALERRRARRARAIRQTRARTAAGSRVFRTRGPGHLRRARMLATQARAEARRVLAEVPLSSERFLPVAGATTFQGASIAAPFLRAGTSHDSDACVDRAQQRFRGRSVKGSRGLLQAYSQSFRKDDFKPSCGRRRTASMDGCARCILTRCRSGRRASSSRGSLPSSEAPQTITRRVLVLHLRGKPSGRVVYCVGDVLPYHSGRTTGLFEQQVRRMRRHA
jgi:hypothetical protein